MWLDSELLHGSSGPSATFGNVCLCRPPNAAPPEDGSALPDVGEFRCAVLEVWGMEHSASRPTGLELVPSLVLLMRSLARLLSSC